MYLTTPEHVKAYRAWMREDLTRARSHRQPQTCTRAARGECTARLATRGRRPEVVGAA